MSGNVCVRSVTQTAITVSDHGRADDSQSKSSAETEKSNSERKLQIFLRVFEKINMVFILIFVCYLSWTIPAHYGLYSGKSGSEKSSGNNTLLLQVEDANATEKHIPFFNHTAHNRTDATYHTDIVLPTHRKQSNRRKKKHRNRKRNRHRKGKKFYANIEDYLNLTDSKHKDRKSKNSKISCKDCTIRKRKGRNKYGSRRMNKSMLRKILERIADETLSGARSGEGSISSLAESDLQPTSDFKDKPHEKKYGSDGGKGSSSSQNWLSLATQTGYTIDGNILPKDDFSKWSQWSPCSTSCGAGQQERTRRCGTACKEVESMVCINPSCEGVDETVNSKTITEFYQWENEGFMPPASKPEQEFLDHGVDACDKWMECNREIAQKFINKSKLPACPCSFPLKRVKSRAIHDSVTKVDVLWQDVSTHNVLVYKPGAKYCIRSQLAPGAVTLAVQQCCYDTKYSLLTRGKAAGTPNQVSPYISKELHYKVDLLPWIVCKGDWTRYNQVLPPNNDLKCKENPGTKQFERQRLAVKNY